MRGSEYKQGRFTNVGDLALKTVEQAIEAIAAMERNSLGKGEKTASQPPQEGFGEIADTLHIKYFYGGNYPRETFKEEFNKWLKKVEEYVKKLEAEVRERHSIAR